MMGRQRSGQIHTYSNDAEITTAPTARALERWRRGRARDAVLVLAGSPRGGGFRQRSLTAGVTGTGSSGSTPDLVVWNGVSATWLHIQYRCGHAVEEKRLECYPVPLSATETKKPERVSKPHSSISQRIRQWESGNLKGVLDEIEGNPMEIICLEKDSFKGVKEAMQLKTESCDQKQSEDHLPREESDRKQLPEEELVDVKKEFVQSKVAEECSEDLQAEEIASIGRTEEDQQDQRSKDVQAEEDAQPDGQDHQEDVQQPASEPQEKPELEEEDGRESPLMSTSIARRVHTRTSSENLADGAGEGSPSKGKECKRTLACKLHEERIQLKVCHDRAVAGACADGLQA